MQARSELRILIVSRAFPPALNPEAFATGKLAAALAKAGQRVVVLSSLGNELRESVIDGGFEDSLTIIRVPAWRGSFVRRLIAYGAYSVRTMVPPMHARYCAIGKCLARKAFESGPPDCIYARGLPSSSYYLAAVLARLWRVPLAVHLSDPWPTSSLPEPYPQGNALISLYDKAWARHVFGLASLITFPSRHLADYMTEKVRCLHNKRKLILPHLISEADLAAARGANEKTGKYPTTTMHIVHTGTLDNARNPQSFLLAFGRFLSRHPGAARVSFVGHRFDGLRSMVEELGVREAVTLTEPMSRPKALALSGSADLLLLIEAPCERGIFLPSKFIEYCATDVPILALSPSPGEVADYAASSGAMVVGPANIDGIAATLEEFYTRWMSGTLAGVARDVLRRQLSEPKIAESLIEELLLLKRDTSNGVGSKRGASFRRSFNGC